MKFEDVENARNTYKNVLIKRLSTVGSIALAFLLIIILLNLNSFSDLPFDIMVVFVIFIFFLCFTMVIVSLTTRKYRKAYHRAYKGFFVYKSLTNTFTKLTYEREKGISSELLRATGMINTGDTYSSNDYVHGEYKDVEFTQADVCIQEEHTDSDGNTTYVTIFKGRFMIFDFPKKFASRLEVAEKGFGAAMVPFGKNKSGRKFERVNLESGEFNKIFRTYAEDGFEAFYILDPAMMNNILGLAEKHKGKLFFCFNDNQLIVGLQDGKDAFEPPSIFKPIDEQAETKKITEEINLITGFVDELKLNRKIFK